MWKSKHNRTVLIQEALKPVPVFKMQNFSCKKKKKDIRNNNLLTKWMLQ